MSDLLNPPGAPDDEPAAGGGDPACLRSRREAVLARHRMPEVQALLPLLERARLTPGQRGTATDLARRLVRGLRTGRARTSGVDALMHEFPLSAPEGVALMCLAESLLRVPDAASADRLIRDKLARGDWRAHVGHSPSLFVNAAAWALMLTGELLTPTEHEALPETLGRLLARGGEPLVRRAMDGAVRLLGRQFVAGEDIDAAVERCRTRTAEGFLHSFDMLGEAALSATDAERYVAAYERAIHRIGRTAAGLGPLAAPGISIKLSALHPRYQYAQTRRVQDELYPRLLHLTRLARGYDIGINIDAEESDRLELSLDLLEQLARDPQLADWHGLGFVVQAYQRRAPAVVDWLVTLARATGHRLMVRLVKGAYWDGEIKRAQVEGLADYPVWTRKTHTDVCFLACARALLEARDAIYPQFATHNALTVASIMEIAGPWTPGAYEFQCLHGMGEPLYAQLLPRTDLPARPCRIYAPVGGYAELLGYLVRRLLENGANTSFVHRLVDPQVSEAVLLADPLAEIERAGLAPHPRVPLPANLYPDRINSAGLDLASKPVHHLMREALAVARRSAPEAAPLLGTGEAAGSAPRAVANPMRVTEIIGTVRDASRAETEAALATAAGDGFHWSAQSAARRARVLDDAAQMLEAAREKLAALIVREAGRTLPNALAEVREAVDFCRYYAAQLRAARTELAGEPLGPVVCISPWNFPLAIFVGQVAAALAAGNPVLAKPAEQTTLVAHAATKLMRDAGVPPEALQLLPGYGERVGSWLVGDTRTRGVLFTGSTEVARLIARQLAQRQDDVPLIAETGGQNAMIIDSTALPEQAIQDALVSAFDSAGQRCSALRVLCVQEEIADGLLQRLQEALREWRFGDPAELATDIGPMIDRDAADRVDRYIGAALRAGRLRFHLAVPPQYARQGHFVGPALVDIDAVKQLGREVFGPVLHVLRYRRDELGELLEDLNATGYGLTLGLHTRVDETVDFVTERARVGNLYVNRTQIGAVVGVQPFGGEGLSGTGPKAGGPLMLSRLRRGDLCPLPPQVPANAAPFDALLEWLSGHAPASARPALLGRVAQFRAVALSGRSLELPGPFGERNTLGFHPRGTAWLVAATELERCAQLACALATGNRALLTDSESTRAFVQALPPAVRGRIDLAADPLAAAPDAVLFDGTPAESTAIREQLVLREGPIAPMLHRDPDYDVTRLVTERCVSVNTAAAGGNAQLMGELD